MARSAVSGAGAAIESRRQGFGMGVLKFFLWLTVGWGSSLVYAGVSTAVLFFWTTDSANAVGVLAGYSIYSLLYLIIQIVSLLVDLYRSGGNMVRGLADIGFSLTPLIGPVVLGTMAVMHGFAPTWLTYLVGVILVLTVAIDILAALFYLRATQKTFETPDQAHVG